MKSRKIDDIVKVLKGGGVVVLPTDTIYGISCLALNKESVERVRKIKKRDSGKSFIVLISDISQIELFGIGLFDRTRKFLEKIWPAKVSIIIHVARAKQKEFEFLHGGVGSLAFRMPDFDWLRDVIRQTGPLISTSANAQGAIPAKNIGQAKEQFGQEIDLYVDGGKMDSLPSSLAEIEGGRLKVLRRGEVDLESVDF